ncbi:hypothetical protein ACL02S_23905 [Nocardia sp. 004]|uniref:hypothetical protein n=1 Tax=Nocardia sp. 004 TaxID=3385978 RepID=UPI0039A3AA0D
MTANQPSSVHLCALELRQQLVDLYAAADDPARACPDTGAQSLPPGLCSRIAEIQQKLTDYLITHREELDSNNFWFNDYKLIDHDKRPGSLRMR